MPSRQTADSLVKMAQLAVAVPGVMAIRTMQMLAGGPFPGRATQAEVARMSLEKVQAFAESMSAMNAELYASNQKWMTLAMQQWWNVWLTPWPALNWWAPAFGLFTPHRKHDRKHARYAATKVMAAGIAPVHRRAIGNFRRLSRVKH
jgi:hypothetical protein